MNNRNLSTIISVLKSATLVLLELSFGECSDFCSLTFIVRTKSVVTDFETPTFIVWLANVKTHKRKKKTSVYIVSNMQITSLSLVTNTSTSC